MSRAIILAAGMGTRLGRGLGSPKPLTKVAGVPLVVRVIRRLEEAGVTDVAVVVGHRRAEIVTGLALHRFDLDVSIVVNEEFRKPNGTSVLAARDFVKGPTYLVMSDHLWAPSLLREVAEFPLGEGESVLGVDRRVEGCFDLADATKVRLDGDRVVAIGKELPDYHALDTGVFRITQGLLAALDEADGPAGCSLSDGVARLARRGKMRAADVRGARWIDVDTPEALRAAEWLVARHGEDLEGVALPAQAM